MEREYLIISAKATAEKYLDMLKYIGISVLFHYVLFMIIQIIDFFTELFTFHEEVFMFYILRNVFFMLDLISLILLFVVNYFYIAPYMDDDQKDDSPKFILSIIKLNFTYFIIWSIILFGTAIPRIFLLMTNGGIIGGFTKALIYMKLPLIITIYLHAFVIYIIYKEIMKMIEKFGDILD